MDKSIRWENVDLETARLSTGELTEIRDQMKDRLQSASSLSAGRLKEAIKIANKFLNAPKPRKTTEESAGHYFGEPAVGRYSGGVGQASFVRGGAPGSRR